MGGTTGVTAGAGFGTGTEAKPGTSLDGTSEDTGTGTQSEKVIFTSGGKASASGTRSVVQQGAWYGVGDGQGADGVDGGQGTDCDGVAATAGVRLDSAGNIGCGPGVTVAEDADAAAAGALESNCGTP
ncbi:hypothetical protein C798_16305 [Herbaspirillum rubrisubalbicans Os34]|uniref:Uncharacterized protein n=1 Tax=Herbaspirillum rubrisubalbicans Os34 TaxID=1235827 RepID=A0A6M3ZTN4_9BURK|nr:hypothetical protein C798_16305 [Herbaspirillum rubrisubalbicans Os34]